MLRWLDSGRCYTWAAMPIAGKYGESNRLEGGKKRREGEREIEEEGERELGKEE